MIEIIIIFVVIGFIVALLMALALEDPGEDRAFVFFILWFLIAIMGTITYAGIVTNAPFAWWS